MKILKWRHRPIGLLLLCHSRAGAPSPVPGTSTSIVCCTRVRGSARRQRRRCLCCWGEGARRPGRGWRRAEGRHLCAVGRRAGDRGGAGGVDTRSCVARAGTPRRSGCCLPNGRRTSSKERGCSEHHMIDMRSGICSVTQISAGRFSFLALSSVFSFSFFVQCQGAVGATQSAHACVRMPWRHSVSQHAYERVLLLARSS